MPELNAIGIVAADPARTGAFGRLLGVDLPAAPHGRVEARPPNRVRLRIDTEEVVRGFRPERTRGTGNQLALAFECASPAEVDELSERGVGAGFRGEREPWDAFWGQRDAQLADPDGVPVDLDAPL